MATADSAKESREVASLWRADPPTMDEQRAHRWWWVHYASGTIIVVDTTDRDLASAHRDSKGPPPLGYAPCVCPPLAGLPRRPRGPDRGTPAEPPA